MCTNKNQNNKWVCFIKRVKIIIAKFQTCLCPNIVGKHVVVKLKGMADGQDIKARALATMKSMEDGSATLPVTSSPKKNWDKLSRWIACVCVVTFDLELGQAIEVRLLAESLELCR